MDSEAEDRLLRSVALQNASSILRARQRAEDDLVAAKEELERRTEELERRTSELREETRVLEILNRTAGVLASNLDLESLLQSVTDAGTELSGARFGAFFYNVTDENGDAYQLFTLSGAPREAFEGFGHPRATPVFGPTFRGEDVIRSDDILADPRYGQWAPHHGMPPGHLPVRSYLALPVKSRSGEILGGLFFGHPEPGVFNERSERIVVGIAGQAAITIDNAALYEASQAAAEERSRLLEREHRARVEAERANAMKDDFLATLSHELRTPVNAILGWVQLLQVREAATPEELKRGLETIERNTRMQARLIEDLLDMNRIASGNLRLDTRLVQLPSVVDAAIETVRQDASTKGIHLDSSVDVESCWVSGDPGRLQQIVWNLLSNAIKFTPPGGRVTVCSARVGSQISVSVSDTGTGIRPDFLPHVFDRFRQADASMTREFGGLGVGLSIVSRLVELHGGSVHAESEGEGKGATFIVYLPVSPIQPEAGVIGPEADAELFGGTFEHADLDGIKVLVVEDERDARQLLEIVLAECGADVILAADAAQAMAQADRGRPDVIVCDVGLPDLDGYELLKRMRASRPDEGGRIPAIALTAYARSEDRTRSLRAGFIAHLTKPVEPSELVATVASVAGRSGA